MSTCILFSSVPVPHPAASNFSTSITATFRSGRSARSARARPQMGAAVGSCERSPGSTETPEAVRNLGGVNDWEDWVWVDVG